MKPNFATNACPTRLAAHAASRHARLAALGRRFLDLVSAHDLGSLCALVTDDWTLHGGPPGLPRGPEGLRVLFDGFGPIEQRWTVQDVVVEGNRVLVRATNLCRQEHFLGVPAHGREQLFSAMFLHRIEEERIAETWRNADDLGRLLQLGARIEAQARCV
jgi:hypothetical protein